MNANATNKNASIHSSGVKASAIVPVLKVKSVLVRLSSTIKPAIAHALISVQLIGFKIQNPATAIVSSKSANRHSIGTKNSATVLVFSEIVNQGLFSIKISVDAFAMKIGNLVVCQTGGSMPILAIANAMKKFANRHSNSTKKLVNVLVSIEIADLASTLTTNFVDVFAIST